MTDPGSLLAALLVKPLAVVGAAAVFAAALRRHAAAARHAIWAGAVLAILALPFLGLLLPPLRVPWLPVTIAGSAATRSTVTVSGGAQAATLTGERAGAIGVRRWTRMSRDQASSALPQVLTAVWIAGVLLLGLRRGILQLHTHRIVRRAHVATSPRLRRLFTEQCRSHGLRREPALRLSDELTVPAVAGLMRPVVLLPAAAERWDEADLAAALAHEQGHVVRRDGLVNALADLAVLLYWCNPAVRLAARRVRVESERACDDLVLERGAEPEAYARLLLDVARAAGRGMAPPAATAMARPRELESRLLAVLDEGVARGPLTRRRRWSLAGLGLLVAMPAAAFTTQSRTPVGQAAASEPDRLRDALARPFSERLPGPDPSRVEAGARAALGGPDSALARRLVSALDRAPAHEADLVRQRAAWALARARDGRLVEPLLDALRDRDWRVQSYAAWSLATARDLRAVPLLIPLLAHPAWRLRAMAAYALRESGDPRAGAAMRAALTDRAWQVRLEAVGYVAVAGGPGAAELIRLRLNDRHVAVRLAAEAALTTP